MISEVIMKVWVTSINDLSLDLMNKNLGAEGVNIEAKGKRLVFFMKLIWLEFERHSQLCRRKLFSALEIYPPYLG